MGLDVHVRVQADVLPESVAFGRTSCATGANDAIASFRWCWAGREAVPSSAKRLDRAGGKEKDILDGVLRRSLRQYWYWMADDYR